MIYSTTYVRLPDGSGRPGREFFTQIYALGIGGIALLVCLMIDYRKLAEHSLFLYGGLVAMLIFVLVGGDSAGGAQRWIEVGRFKLQPSEFARMTLALILAMFFGENRRGARTPGDLVIAGLFAAVPFLLIAKQPDLGTAATLVPGRFRYRLPGRAAVAIHRDRALRRRPAGADCLELRAQGLSEIADRDFPRPRAGPAGRGLSADSGEGDRRLRRAHRQGVHERHAGAVQVPACRTQRLHLLGLGRREGFPGGTGRARPVPVRDL